MYYIESLLQANTSSLGSEFADQAAKRIAETPHTYTPISPRERAAGHLTKTVISQI